MIALLLLGLGGDVLTLRESAKVEGRWIRLTDLVETEGLREEVRASIGAVWLGRAPAAGRSRVVSSADVRRELAWRGLSWSVREGEVRVGEGRPELPEAPVAKPAGRVKARDLVRACSTSWEVDARALEAGVEGQVVSCEHLGSRLRFRARVAGEGKVEVVEERK